jgi:uncharacterized membrane protein YpjA
MAGFSVAKKQGLWAEIPVGIVVAILGRDLWWMSLVVIAADVWTTRHLYQAPWTSGRPG